ncbi:MAG TPA: DUF4381 family protein [Chthoniobacteraceae bacterium]|nr:DUF4381 family protein [Chthoniobacteraceae bacterium]
MRRFAVLHGAESFAARAARLILLGLAAGSARAQTPPATPPPIRDIAPPLDLFPYPLWVVVLAGTIAATILATIGWLVFRWWRDRPPPAPPTPRSIALRELNSLRNKARTLPSYEFSIAVSDVLRTFIGAQYGLHAREQTSPEFLAAAAGSKAFTTDERAQLARFLEKADMIKFARLDATERDSEELLSNATNFVEGAPP